MKYHALNRSMFQLFLSAAVAGGISRADFAQESPETPAFWLSHARADAAQLSNPVERAGALTTIAGRLLAAGQPQLAGQAASEADDAAAGIADLQGRFMAQMALAGFHDVAQDGLMFKTLGEAQRTLDGMAAGPAKGAGAEQIARLKAMSAGLNDARRPIDGIAEPAARASAFAQLAGEYSQAGPGHHADYVGAIALALQASDQVPDPAAANMIKSDICQVQVRAGDLAGASAIADKLVDPAAQGPAYSAIADACIAMGQRPQALAAIEKMVVAADGTLAARRAAIWLHVAHARAALGDKAGANAAIDQSVRATNSLETADRADALAAAATVRADMGDLAGGAALATSAGVAARDVTDPQDGAEVNMSVAAALARCGQGAAAMNSITAAETAGASIPKDKQSPGGDPQPPDYLDVIQAAAAAGDFATASAIAASRNDPHLKHDAALAIAEAHANRAEYQAAEDVVAKEGSMDAEASVCAIIAGSLARTRSGADAEKWVERLPSASDKVAARLAVAGEVGRGK